MVIQSFRCRHKKKTVKVTVEFPVQSNPKAEQEFTDRLKEIYLEKIKNGLIQGKETEPMPIFIRDKEKMSDDEKSTNITQGIVEAAASR